MVGRREPRGIGPCPPLLPPPPACRPHTPLAPHSPPPCHADRPAVPLTVSGAARRVSARARGVARHTGAGPTSAPPSIAHRRSTAIEVAAAPPSGRRRLSRRGACWRLGCPSLTDAVVWPAGGRTPDRSRLLHPRRTSSPNVFSKSSTHRIRKFPERQGSAPDPAPACAWDKVSPGGFSPGVLGTITALADRSLRFWKRR